MKKYSGGNSYSCEVCMKSFADISNLTRHERVHSGENPYSCEVCMKSFKQSGQLTMHVMKHSGEKPYSHILLSYK